MMYARQHPDYITITCLEWKYILKEDRFKDIVIDSLSFLVREERVSVYAFVMMSNHFHLVWQMQGDNKRESVQRDFLRFTAQQVIKILQRENLPMLEELRVNAKDRKYQVWERNSLSIPLWSEKAIWQKIRYIHENPVRAGLCKKPEEYRYSSALYYYLGECNWNFLTHIDG